MEQQTTMEPGARSLRWIKKIQNIVSTHSPHSLIFIVLGSLARHEVTEWSDLEFILFWNTSYPYHLRQRMDIINLIIENLVAIRNCWVGVDAKLRRILIAMKNLLPLNRLFKSLSKQRNFRMGGLFDCFSLSSSISTKKFAQLVYEKTKNEQKTLFCLDLNDYSQDGLERLNKDVGNIYEQRNLYKRWDNLSNEQQQVLFV